jgi:hypothetical protein
MFVPMLPKAAPVFNVFMQLADAHSNLGRRKMRVQPISQQLLTFYIEVDEMRWERKGP